MSEIVDAIVSTCTPHGRRILDAPWEEWTRSFLEMMCKESEWEWGLKKINYVMTAQAEEKDDKTDFCLDVGSTGNPRCRQVSHLYEVVRPSDSPRYAFYVKHNVEPKFIEVATYESCPSGLIEIGETVWTIILGTFIPGNNRERIVQECCRLLAIATPPNAGLPANCVGGNAELPIHRTPI